MQTDQLWRRIWIVVGIMLTLSVICSFGSYAAYQTADEANEAVDSLQENVDVLTGKLKDLNRQLAQIAQEIDETQEQINTVNKEMSDNKKAVKHLQEKCVGQYENMKNRIRYLYEQKGTSYLTVILEADSFAEFINRIEYVSAINEYDRQMLKNYEQNLEEVSARSSRIEEEKDELVALKQSLKEKQQSLTGLIADAKSQINSRRSELAKAMKAAEELTKELDAKKDDSVTTESIEKEEKAEDNADKRETDTSKDSADSSEEMDANQVEMMAAIIECEAGGESYECMLAVGSVVMNRIESKSFPNTLEGVLYQSGQFSPVASGKFALVLARGASDTCVKAAKEVLGGRRTNSYLFFRDCYAYHGSASDYKIIDEMIFY